MKSRIRTVFFVSVCLSWLPLSAPEARAENAGTASNEVEGRADSVKTNDATVTRVFQKMIRQHAGDWSYQRQEVKDDETVVETFDSARGSGKGWSLTSVNGKPPESSRLEKYEQESAARTQRTHPGDFKLHEMADLNSFERIDSGGARAAYRFDVANDDEDGKDIAQHLEGRLDLDLDELEIISLRIYSKEPFSPVFSVNVEKMDISFSYAPSSSGKPQFMSEVKQSTQGKIMGMKKIDERSTIVFSGFKAPAP